MAESAVFKNWRSRNFLSKLISLSVALLMLEGTFQPSRAETWGDRLLSDYKLLIVFVDPETNLQVELGLNANFSSYDVQVVLYDAPLAERWTSFDTGIDVFHARRVPEDVSLKKEESCYVIVYDFDTTDITVIHPEILVPHETEPLCFKIKSRNGKRVLEKSIEDDQ